MIKYDKNKKPVIHAEKGYVAADTMASRIAKQKATKAAQAKVDERVAAALEKQKQSQATADEQARIAEAKRAASKEAYAKRIGASGTATAGTTDTTGTSTTTPATTGSELAKSKADQLANYESALAAQEGGEAYKVKAAEESAAIAAQRAQAQRQAAAGIEQGQQAATSQQSLINQLQGQAAGTAPSLVEAQMKAAGDRSLAQQLAAAGASRGGNQAALQRTLAKQQATSGQELAQTAGVAKLQEQQAAQQQLASAIGQQQNAALQAQQLYQSTLQQGLSQGLSLAQAQQQAAYSQKQLEQQADLAQKGLLSAEYMQQKQGQQNLIGGILGMFSDKRLKKDIKSGDKDIQSFMKAFESKEDNHKEIVKKETPTFKNGGSPSFEEAIGDLDDSEDNEEEKSKAIKFTKALEMEKGKRYEKATGKKAPEMFKGDSEIRAEREERLKREVNDPAYHHFAEGGINWGSLASNAASNFASAYTGKETKKPGLLQSALESPEDRKKREESEEKKSSGGAYPSGLIGALMQTKFAPGGVAGGSEAPQVEELDTSDSELESLDEEDKTDEDAFDSPDAPAATEAAPETKVEAEVEKLDTNTASENKPLEYSEYIPKYSSASGAAQAQASFNQGARLREKAMSMFSDERVKKDVKTGDGDVKGFLSALKAHKYKYKDPSMPMTGSGDHISVMAQELEKTPIGKTLVEEMPNGFKAVNYGKGFGVILAAQANLNKRLEEIEKKKKK